MTAETSVRDFSRSRAFEALARAGYVSRGLIYVLIGVLAFGLARNHTAEHAPNQQGAIAELLEKPLGKVLVAALAVGLLGYAVWRFVQAAVGRTPEQGSYSTGERVAAVASGLAYTLFLGMAVTTLIGAAKKTPPKSIAADVMTWPAGRLLIVLAGLVFIGVGAYQAKLAISRDFDEYSKTHEMPKNVARTFYIFGRVGHLARAVIFAVVGVFLCIAGLQGEAGEVVGIDGALVRLLQQPWGEVLAGAVALGLLVFGLYSLLDARYRKI